ncbi:MAG: EAL domain-containing protein [Desulfuromonadaceae bacterium]|nr:EAL domain-containing protein [Desulfuromonadaceae bacterium]
MKNLIATKRLWLGLLLAWTSLILVLAFEQYRNQEQLVLKMAAAELQGSFNKDLVYRRWVAKQGGVYVPVSEHTPPNPYLAHLPHRDVETTSGKQLTLVNPAYMTRQVHELAAQQYGAKGHITSLYPLRPENIPDAWEGACLEAIEKNPQDFTELAQIEGEEYLRFIRPMYTESICLKCHAAQGYQLGDIRGGISVSIPLASYRAAQWATFRTNLSHLLLIWGVGSALLLALKRVTQRQLTQERHVQSVIALSEEKYRSLFNESLIGIGLADFETGTMVDCNRQLAALVERTLEELIGQSQKILHPLTQQEETRSVTDDFDDHRRSGSGTIRQTQVITKSGRLKDVLIQSNQIMLNGRKHLFGLFMDITERMAVEKRNHLLLEAINQSPVSILLVTRAGQPIYVNHLFEQRKGYSLQDCADPENPVHQFIKNRVHAFDLETQSGVAPESWLEERLARAKSGSSYWERTTIAPVHDPQGRISHFVVLGEDITEEKQNAEHFEYLSTHDSLTGLANRLLLNDRLDQAILQAKRTEKAFYLILLDIDRFKRINDSLGHDVGDMLLQQVAERLRASLRESDTLVRLGGDEFVVLLTDVSDQASALRIVNAIHQQIVLPFDLLGKRLNITASVGVCSYPAHGATALELLRHADAAMYKAKEQSSPTCLFEKSMDGVLVETLDIESDLRQALVNNELLLHYQPKIDTVSGKIVGLEALLRWCHPNKGLIPPGVFIPVAEQSELIVDIGLWVIDAACRQLALWQQAGLCAVPVAVNLAARQFESKNLVSQVKAKLKQYQIDARWLEFELTESMIMGNPLASIKIMRGLKEAGIRLAVDDFGTGYSSLNYLRRLPLDYLKIDRSFIDDVTKDASADAVATSIILIARSLGMETIAEGVETVEQFAFLQQNSCDYIQGYYFYKPMPAEQLEEHLR